jgi:hypothetical protein
VSAPGPRPPLPPDLQYRLDILLAKPSLSRFPELSQAITRLVLDAWCRQPAPEAMRSEAVAPGLAVQGAPDWTQPPPWPGIGQEERG